MMLIGCGSASSCGLTQAARALPEIVVGSYNGRAQSPKRRDIAEPRPRGDAPYGQQAGRLGDLNSLTVLETWNGEMRQEVGMLARSAGKPSECRICRGL